MDHIASILGGLLARSNLRQGVANYSFFSKWEQVVGRQLAVSTRPLRIQGSTLWVYVENSTLQHHLSLLVPQLLTRIRECAPESCVENIRFTQNSEQNA
jgi:predicted nucleic acid-binding Zn ribbon protein